MKKNTDIAILHFILYNRGHAGMCNILMSLQSALLIAKLTHRAKIIFYYDIFIYNSSKKLTIFDLYDIDFEYSIMPLSEYPDDMTALPSFSSCCFYKDQQPGRSFMNGRKAVDLDRFSHLEHIGTDAITLGYYSYQFYLKGSVRDRIVTFVKEGITPKQKYVDAARRIADSLGDYQSVHMRRGDYLAVAGTRNAQVGWDEILPNVTAQLDKGVPVLIHTDENDETYFEPMAAAGYDLRFFEKDIDVEFDQTEKGLISLLVGTRARRFMGTMISTFSGIIHQRRRQFGDTSPFCYLYSQIDTVKVENGEIRYAPFGVNSWNRLQLSDAFKKTLFFAMEHQECYPDETFDFQHVLRIYPDFLDPEEIAYLVAIIESDDRPEHDGRQNRNRTFRRLEQDEVLVDIAARIKAHIGVVRFENGVQFMDHLTGGETFLHSDALCSGSGARRLASVLLYLNDDYEGGHLDFPYLQSRISPAKGMMIYFPIVNKYGEQVEDFSHSAGVIIGGAKRMCYLSVVPAPAAGS